MEMNVSSSKPLIGMIYNLVKHYNSEKYWKMRSIVINPSSKVPRMIKMIYLYRIKRMDAFNNASMGTDLNHGAIFKSPPILVHGLNGIIISRYTIIGDRCEIYQQVTITQNKYDKSATIGDDCLIGAGAKIIGEVRIGDNVKIGANAVVVEDIPDNCTVVGVPARIVKQNSVSVNH